MLVFAAIALTGCERQEPPTTLSSVEKSLDSLKLSKKHKAPANKAAAPNKSVDDSPGFERLDSPKASLQQNTKVSWPPRYGARYPDLSLMDYRGEVVRLSQFQGKVILVEPIAMTCAGCNAFSGGNRFGAYPGARSQDKLYSIEQYFPNHTAGVPFNSSNLIFVQIVLLNMRNQEPSLADIKAWAKHFHLDGRENVYVLAGTKDLLGKASTNMIPGFQLIDQNFILRSDSTGHKPRDDLFRTLLPMIPKLLL